MKKNLPSILFACFNFIFVAILIFIVQPIFWRSYNSSIDKLIVKIFLLLLLIIVLSTIIYVFVKWKKGKVNSLIPFISILIALIWLLLSITLPKAKIQPEKTLGFINKNIQMYSRIALEYNSLADKKEGYYELSPKYQFLSENGRIELVKENNLFIIIFTLKSFIGYGEFLVYSPIDKSFHDGYPYYKVTRLRENWFFIVEK